MTDHELDQLFAAARESTPEIAPVRADVMRRVRVRQATRWLTPLAVGAAAAALAFVTLRPAPVDWNVPLAAIPAIQAEAVPLKLTASKPPQRRANIAAATRRATQPMEIKLFTDDPDVVIIWLSEGGE